MGAAADDGPATVDAVARAAHREVSPRAEVGVGEARVVLSHLLRRWAGHRIRQAAAAGHRRAVTDLASAPDTVKE